MPDKYLYISHKGAKNMIKKTEIQMKKHSSLLHDAS